MLVSGDWYGSMVLDSGCWVGQGCQCGMFGHIRPRHTQRFISASSILWPKKKSICGCTVLAACMIELTTKSSLRCYIRYATYGQGGVAPSGRSTWNVFNVMHVKT